MVSFDGTVKLLDFGIAKAASSVEATRAGEIKGKLSYMSPEQCMGQPLDHRSDLFSLGVVLYEWATGFKLFTGESDVAVLKSITDGRVYPPSYFKPDVPEALEQILMKALQRNPDDRYQSAWDMQYDIDRFLASNEFSPSNIHLANFLKQLFADEMDEETRRLSLQGRPLPPLRNEDDPSPVTYPGATGVELPSDQMAALEAIAARHSIDVSALVREVVGDFLKYR